MLMRAHSAQEDHRQRRESRTRQGEHRSDDRAARHLGFRSDDHDNADKADDYRTPAVDMDALAQDCGGQHDDEKRRRKSDCGRIRERKQRIGGEVAEHGDGAGNRAQRMAVDALGRKQV